MTIPNRRRSYASTYTHESRLDFGWWASNGPSGGHLTAVALDLDARRPTTAAPRTVDVQMLRLPKAAPFEAEVSAHLGAARLEITSIQLRQETPFAAASVYSTPPLEATSVPAADPPAVLPPQAYSVMTMPAWTSPPVTARFEYRPIPALDPSSWEVADLVWVRRHRPRSGRLGVAEAIDCWYPALGMHAVRQFLRGDISYLMEPPATNLLSVHTLFPGPDDAYGLHGHLLLAGRLIAATDGYSSEEIEVWSELGDLLAVSQILRREQAAPFRADVR
jgi:hypothetical protein